MLSHLKINNFAIASDLDIELQSGLSTITGETGAGKSIMIDALSLALGARSRPELIGAHADKAHIIASFDITQNKPAQTWLASRSLEAEDECILRRVLTSDGKSKAYINGIPSPLQDIKQLSEHLINIHSQHQHQQLLKKDTHRKLLDTYSNTEALVSKTETYFRSWQQIKKELLNKAESEGTRLARIEFLEFQLDELETLDLHQDEYQSLNEEQKKLANAEHDIALGRTLSALLNEDEDFNVSSALNKSISLLSALATTHSQLHSNLNAINEALILIDESSSDINHYLDQLALNPEKLAEIDQRLALIHKLSRKHNVSPDNLYEFHQKLRQEFETLTDSSVSTEQLEQQCAAAQQEFIKYSSELTQIRIKTAKKLDKTINLKFHELGMENASIKTHIEALDIIQAKPYGLDDIEICVATSPNQAHQSLSKIASGGELSRISLAIQVCFAEKTSIPSLIFDEVDVGIGGATAEVVGRLLKQLAKHGQVICVTHLAQVAAQGVQHYKVHKQKNAQQQMSSEIALLTDDERVQEVSRMLGGVELTEKTQSHAEEMLALARANAN